jgi:hypothetical protein
MPLHPDDHDDGYVTDEAAAIKQHRDGDRTACRAPPIYRSAPAGRDISRRFARSTKSRSASADGAGSAARPRRPFRVTNGSNTAHSSSVCPASQPLIPFLIGRLHRLAVQDRRTRAGLAPGTLPPNRRDLAADRALVRGVLEIASLEPPTSRTSSAWVLGAPCSAAAASVVPVVIRKATIKTVKVRAIVVV